MLREPNSTRDLQASQDRPEHKCFVGATPDKVHHTQWPSSRKPDLAERGAALSVAERMTIPAAAQNADKRATGALS
jgi:hypothetical protein